MQLLLQVGNPVQTEVKDGRGQRGVGVALAEHLAEVLDAALAASIFHFGLNRIADLKQELRAAGIPVRWPC